MPLQHGQAASLILLQQSSDERALEIVSPVQPVTPEEAQGFKGMIPPVNPGLSRTEGRSRRVVTSTPYNNDPVAAFPDFIYNSGGKERYLVKNGHQTNFFV